MRTRGSLRLALLVGLTVACDSDGRELTSLISPTSPSSSAQLSYPIVAIQIDPLVPIELRVGMARTTTALAIRADRTTRTLLTDGIWGSDNARVATVRATLGSPFATIEAVGVGTATIFVDAEGVRGTIPVNVSEGVSS